MFASRWNGEGCAWTSATVSTRHGCSIASAGTKLSRWSRLSPGTSSTRKATAVTMRIVRVTSGGDTERAGRFPVPSPCPVCPSHHGTHSAPMLTSGRCSLLGDVDLLDDDGLGRLVHRAGGHALDGVDDLLARFIGDLAEDGVLAVEPRGLGGGDEELRTVGSASHLLAGVGHGQQVLAVELE